MAAEILRFADFELDREAYELRRNGHVVRLQRIPLELLFLLVERRGQLVTREEIFERIWGKKVFLDTESSINTAVRKLRQSLSDDRGDPRFIVTVPAKGYRFIAELHKPVNSAASSHGVRPASRYDELKVAESSGGPIGERRHLTVMVCALTNHGGRTAFRDPDQWWALVAEYHRAVSQAIERYGGHVCQYRGDGLMAYFGWPEAHDNDAELAARAGLATLDAIVRLNQVPAHPRFSSRIGIDSGAVVVRTSVGKDVDIFGDSPIIAAGVQAAADPDTVFMTAETERLVAGLFVVEDRGVQVLKGVERPVQLYRVIRPSGVRGRFEAAVAAGGLTPFIGRDDELRALQGRWERALEGEGQVALVIGEAGIGKSRLVQRFREQIAGTPHTWVQATTREVFRNTPFYAVADMLQQNFHRGGNQKAEDRLAVIEASLAAAGVKVEEAMPLVAPLLELPLDDKYAPLPMAPDQQRKRLLATLVAWTIGAAGTQPLLIAIEDLHWADPSTLELIQLLAEQCATARLLLLYTARPEFRVPWPPRSNHMQIALGRLSSRHVHKIVRAVAAPAALSEETVTTVVKRTSGVPLFAEELTRAVLENGDSMLTGGAIPRSLQDSLMARLDRLGRARQVIQVGSVIGSDFSYELLHAIDPIEEEELQLELRKLAEAELLYVRGVAPDSSYQFKHALIRDAAYQALLKSTREDLHRRVARTIDERFPAIKEAQPEVLARHWSEAGETETAIAAWSQAGAIAQKRNAFREAQENYRQALALLSLLPQSNERDTRELSLQVELGSVVAAISGWSAADTASVYARARTLAERAGDAEAVQVYLGLWSTALTRGELQPAFALAGQMIEIASGLDNASALVTAHWAQGLTRHYRGDLVGAHQHFLAAIEHYREDQFHDIPNDLGVTSRYFEGINAWHIGHIDQAVTFVDDAISLARRQNNPFALANALTVGSLQVHVLRGDFEGVIASADEAMRLSNASGFSLWNAICNINIGWARAQMGEAIAAVKQMREALAEFDRMSFYLSRTWFLCLLSESQRAAGELNNAFETVEQALQINPEEAICRPSVFRLRGELRLQSGATGKVHCDLAEQDFREAIGLARQMGAKSDELRATTSLAGLLRDTSRIEEARLMLVEICAWFTEGLATAHLKEAKALLDQLSWPRQGLMQSVN
jgi:class 3 adenylate cyclase/tetratricopeptide (TPR) repeat protein